ncbi:MAG: lysophospholipid acyltransferase family protein [Acidimicrobiia bacterium]|nr:lysophospholipid acyltransferase family protein [Acidimicrobiia bacterium]
MPDLAYSIPRGLVRALRFPSHFVTSTVFDLEVTGKEHVPQRGSVVIAANHFSHLDVPLIGLNLDRFLRFLAVDELYGRNLAFDAALNLFGAIPLDRDGYPVAALRTAIAYLEDGHAIGVFPEGRRVESWGVDPPKRGAAWLAWMTGAPLLPVTIYGTHVSMAPEARSFTRAASRIWIDEPLWWHDYTDRIDPLQSMMDTWYEVVNEHLEPWRSLDT